MFSVIPPPTGRLSPDTPPTATPRRPAAPEACPEPADLPEVEVRALAFHRWRTLKWQLRFTEPGAPAAREARTPTFDAALALAREWSLAYRARRAGGTDAG